jgi:hypothetical protein
MIVFELRCSQGHRFEAWFRDNAAFDQQCAEGSLECPWCADRDIGKAPMAPHVIRGGRASADEGGVAGGDPAAQSPARLRQALDWLRRQVEANCDYVGADFPEEARRIHYRESDPRGIYGEASERDARELREEGIRVQAIPWLTPRDD